jgi:N-acetylglucosaminyl-diphospho-decaprenol L-rhamnosyltransferase
MLFTISIVSHGHGDLVIKLINDIARFKECINIRIMLTLNAPEIESTALVSALEASLLPVSVIKNHQRKGFAANHNAALLNADTGIWCILNPDIIISHIDLLRIRDLLFEIDTGLVFPRQYKSDGKCLDYKRELVTPWSLCKRYILPLKDLSNQIEWVSGCFMAFRSDVYQQLGGLDEKYFLYCEDVDICLRLQLAGYKMVEADFSIIHDTRRSTLKKCDHFKWHVSSLLKLWCSRVFWAYLWDRHKIRQR